MGGVVEIGEALFAKVFSHNEWFLQSVDWVDGQATKYAMQLWLEGGSDGVNFTT